MDIHLYLLPLPAAMTWYVCPIVFVPGCSAAGAMLLAFLAVTLNVSMIHYF